jgi:hypothetical protein
MPKSIFLSLSIALWACQSPTMDWDTPIRELHQDFGSYWFQGKAEISTFTLNQHRYGENVSGTAVLIFVSEDFSRENKVKVDRVKDQDPDQIKVLKLNATRDFLTGIYPYHTMVSVFTPIFEQHPSLKLNASVQEWCGMAFTEIKHAGGNDFEIQLHSYFEKEANYSGTAQALPEDELWTSLRLMRGPEEMPQGEHLLLPGMLVQRFNHKEWEAQAAILSWDTAPLPEELMHMGELMCYKVHYPATGAELRIYLRPDFPYQIMAWEEKSAENAALTRAIWQADTLLDYWRYNRPKDVILRSSLGLD